MPNLSKVNNIGLMIQIGTVHNVASRMSLLINSVFTVDNFFFIQNVYEWVLTIEISTLFTTINLNFHFHL